MRGWLLAPGPVLPSSLNSIFWGVVLRSILLVYIYTFTFPYFFFLGGGGGEKVLQRFSSSLSNWASVSSSMVVGMLAAARARSACHLR